MAITRTGSGKGHSSGNATSLTLTAQAAGAADLLIIWVDQENTTNTDTITSVQFNGNNLTLIDGIAASSGNEYMTAYYIAGANASGTHDIVINSSSSKSFGVIWAAYSGTSPTLDGHKSAAANTTALAVTWTVNNANAWAAVAAYPAGGSDLVSSITGMTVVQDDGPVGPALYDTNGVVGSTGSQTFTVNGPSGPITAIGVSFAPVSTAALEWNHPISQPIPHYNNSIVSV